MKKAGIGGINIFEIGVPQTDTMVLAGPAFMSEQSINYIEYAIKQAHKLNLKVNLNLASSWNAGGSWTLPQNQAKRLYYSRIKVKGPKHINLSLPFPEVSKVDKDGNQLIPLKANGRPVYYEDVAILAIPAGIKKNTLDTGRILNLSKFFNSHNERLDCNIPAGEWEIYRYVCSNSGEQLVLPSPNSHGPIIDHFDSIAVKTHIEYFIDHLRDIVEDSLQNTLKGLYLASYEAKGLIWTPSLPTEFKTINGYNIYKYIPILFEQGLYSRQIKERFQSDFNKVLSELMINNLYKEASKICNRFGLKIIAEAGGPGLPIHNVPAEPLEALGSVDVPRGEFWYKHVHYNKDSIDIMRVVKEVAAASHIYDKKIVEEEAFTSFQHWQVGPFDLKPIADRAFCEGMNKVIMHGFSHSPAGTGCPGFVYHAGTHFSDKNPCWDKIRPFIDYLGRISYILQKGTFVSDVLYYYGDTIPNYVAPKNTRFSIRPGYDYEVINSDILLKLSVKDGKIVLPNGSKFKLLALGNIRAIHPIIIKKLNKLVNEGAIITGPEPKQAIGLLNYPNADNMIKKEADQLWTTNSQLSDDKIPKQNKIFSELSLLKILQELHVLPDLEYNDDSALLLDYIHSIYNNKDFYFIRNTTDRWISRKCSFRQKNKFPELWDPVSGEVYPITIYHQYEHQIEIPLSFPPYGAYFVVFKKGSSSSHYNDIKTSDGRLPIFSYTKYGLEFLRNGTFTLIKEKNSKKVINDIKSTNINGAWEVSFPPDWGAPHSINFPKLISWTQSDYDGIKYFSGTATYHKTFLYKNTNLDSNKVRLYLNLGNLSKVGKVWLNDKLLGITWSLPHRFDITNLINNGRNTLKVEISNTWSNRLTGDAITGNKYTNTNIGYSVRGITWKHTQLIKSGLIGPVTLQLIKLIH